MRARRISAAAERERQLREAAIEEATALFARHGSNAMAIVSDRLTDQSRTPEQRRGDRLTLLTVERLDRERRQGSSNTALVLWRPTVWSRLASLLGLGRRRGT